MKNSFKVFFGLLVCVGVIHLYSATPYLRPAGFKRGNNTCFMNAGLQALTAMDEVTSVIAHNKKRLTSESLAASYRAMLPRILRGTTVLNPTKLYAKGWMQLHMKPGTQGDAGEFLTSLLNCLEKEYDDDFAELYTLTLESSIPDYTPVRTENVTCLTLSVNQGDRRLSDCLTQYFTPEREKVRDTKTGILIDRPREKYLEKTPPYLILSLNRNSYRYNPHTKRLNYIRRSNALSFPLTGLSMNEFGTNKDFGSYNLVALVMHTGSGVSGHYTAYTQRDSPWYYCDDSSISPVSQTKVVTLSQGASTKSLPTTFVYKRTAN